MGIRDFIEKRSITSQVVIAANAVVILLAIGTISFRYLEDWTWVEAFYFSTYTLTTVGYGNLYPTTEGSMLCASLYMLVGVTIAVGAVGVIGSSYLRRREEELLRRVETRESKGSKPPSVPRRDDAQDDDDDG
jgi:voltage-gated potassium channel